jgi:hypothetical protein
LLPEAVAVAVAMLVQVVEPVASKRIASQFPYQQTNRLELVAVELAVHIWEVEQPVAILYLHL